MATPPLDALRRRAAPDAAGRLSPAAAAVLAAGFVGLAGLAAALLPGVQNDPKRFVWYRGLKKSKLTPPDPVFGLAWPLIESAIAYGAFRLLQRPASPQRDRALGFFAGNTLMIPAYQLLFFTARNLTGGLVISTVLVAGAWAYFATAWREDRRAAFAGLPLALWTSFAEYLMFSVWRLNSRNAR